MSVFNGDAEAPCYRCLFPTPPDVGSIPNCSEAGVLGVLPGVVGMIQATEAIKEILGIGRSLRGRLLVYDALQMGFNDFKLAKNPSCPLCGEKPSITELEEIELLCPSQKLAKNVEISPSDLQTRIDSKDDILLIDVREEWESQYSSIGEIHWLRNPFDEPLEFIWVYTGCATPDESGYATCDLFDEANTVIKKNIIPK